MTVLFSATTDKRQAYHVGRVRRNPTSSVLYINETSANLSDGDTIFILNDYRIVERLPRFASDTLFVDYDFTYAPPAPVIYGLQSAYAGWASGSPEGYTVAFTAQAFTVASGATIASYAWTLPSGATATAGNVNTASVTVRFDPSADEYWLKLVVTDSNGTPSTRYIPVWSHSADFPPATGFNGASIRGDLDTGFNASVGAFDGVSALLDNTLTCIWSVDRYNDTEVAINGNVNFVGRLRRESTGGDGDENYSTLPRDTEFEIEGAGSQLSRLTAFAMELTTASAPAIVGQISTMTVWRAIAYFVQICSTYSTLHSLQFDDTTATFQYPGVVTQGGSMLAAINDLAQSINGAIEFAPAGESQVVRDAVYLSTSARNSLMEVADWGESDVLGIGVQREHVNLVGRIEAQGGSYNANNGETMAVLSVAPGVAQAEGEGTGQLTRQILSRNLPKESVQSELNTRAGHKFADENRDTALDMTLPDGYYFLTPSRALWHTWTISANTNNRGITFTSGTRWLLTSISFTHDNESGTNDVQASFDIETVGAPGQAVVYPPPTEIDTALPPLPPFNAYPSFPDIQISLPSLDPLDLPAWIDNTGVTNTDVLSDGNTAVVATTTQAWVLTDIKISATPPATEITPSLGSGEEIRAFKWSGFGVGGYMLTYDTGDNVSRVWRSSDVLAGSWTAGEWMSGEFTILLTTANEDELYVVNQDTVADEDVFSFFDGNGDLTAPYELTASVGGDTCTPTYDSVNDWIEGCVPAAGQSAYAINLLKEFSGQTIVALSASYAYRKTRQSGALPNEAVVIQINEITVDSDTLPPAAGSTGTGTLSWTGSETLESIGFIGAARNFSTGDGAYFRLTALSYTISTAAANVSFRYSVDGGEAFEPDVVVGTSPGSAGADVIPLRDELLIGRSNGVESNIDAGAGGETVAYGDAIPNAGVRPSLIIVPRRQIGTTSTSNSNTTPDYVLGSSTLDTATDEIALYAVTDEGTTFTDITPAFSGDYGTTVSPNSAVMPWSDGDKIAGIFEFNESRRLYVSSSIGSWSDRGLLEDVADYIRMRKNDANNVELYYVAETLRYSPDFGQTRFVKVTPNDGETDPLILVEVYDA